MKQLLSCSTFVDDRGILTVVEKLIPFNIKRFYYIYNVDNALRGGHRHRKTRQAAICLQGSCRFFLNNNIEQVYIELNNPTQCLVIEPEDWHTMDNFSKDCILLVLASEFYDKNDYIDEPYTKKKEIND